MVRKKNKNPINNGDLTSVLYSQAGLASIAGENPSEAKSGASKEGKRKPGKPKGCSVGPARFEIIPGEKERALTIEWPESLIRDVKEVAYAQHMSVKLWLADIAMKRIKSYKANK